MGWSMVELGWSAIGGYGDEMVVMQRQWGRRDESGLGKRVGLEASCLRKKRLGREKRRER